MVSLGTTDLRKNCAEYIGRVLYGKERFTVQKNGRPACAIISIEDLHILEAIEDKLDIQAAETAIQQKETVSWETLKQKNGL